jgi:hypothetical protein
MVIDMKAADLQAYLNRWKAVEEVERQELAAATFEERWQQFNSLLCLASELGILPQPDDIQETIYYQRWASIKIYYER